MIGTQYDLQYTRGYPVLRGTLIIVHEFRKLLDKAGFDVDDVVFAEVPDRACTGFIVARNRA